MTNTYPLEAYQDQFLWAKYTCPSIRNGVKVFDKYPLDILNPQAILMLVDEVENEEMADFVFRLATCKKFDVCFMPYPKYNNFRILTEFDWISETRHCHGKYDLDCNYSGHKQSAAQLETDLECMFDQGIVDDVKH